MQGRCLGWNTKLSRNDTGSTISTLLHDRINPKDCQVLSLGDTGFLHFFRVVSRDYGKPRDTLKHWVSETYFHGACVPSTTLPETDTTLKMDVWKTSFLWDGFLADAMLVSGSVTSSNKQWTRISVSCFENFQNVSIHLFHSLGCI